MDRNQANPLAMQSMRRTLAMADKKSLDGWCFAYSGRPLSHLQGKGRAMNTADYPRISARHWLLFKEAWDMLALHGQVDDWGSVECGRVAKRLNMLDELEKMQTFILWNVGLPPASPERRPCPPGCHPG
jgi:hypothetical protein